MAKPMSMGNNDGSGAFVEDDFTVGVTVEPADFFADFLGYEAFVDNCGFDAVGADQRLELRIQQA